jgi:hypothetical protein
MKGQFRILFFTFVLLYTGHCQPNVVDPAVTSDITIESPIVTEWGDWGKMELCPEGTYASGMVLKWEPHLGEGKGDDDTALNAIRLLCIPPGSNDFDNATAITSTVGEWGDWGRTLYCDGGVITGFQLRSEPFMGHGGWEDDTGANNVRILCSNLVNEGYLEGDSVPGSGWGYWTQPQRCLTQQAVCGLQTQVQSWIGSGDDTALNNVRMRCCTVPNLASSCPPSDAWETVLECDNTNGTTPLLCTYEKVRGVSTSSTASEGQLHEYSVIQDLGFTSSLLYNGLSLNFRYNLSTSSSTGYHWAAETSETFQEKMTTSAQFQVPGGMRSTLSQAVGSCGLFNAYTNYFMKRDQVVDAGCDRCGSGISGSISYFYD